MINNTILSSTVCDLDGYVSSLPPAVHSHLEYQLDWDNDVDRDLREIARHMLDWDLKLATHLQLTEIDISDIKEENQNKPELQRCEFYSNSNKKFELYFHSQTRGTKAMEEE